MRRARPATKTSMTIPSPSLDHRVPGRRREHQIAGADEHDLLGRRPDQTQKESCEFVPDRRHLLRHHALPDQLEMLVNHVRAALKRREAPGFQVVFRALH
jgi:hypothetical protein